MALVSDGFRLVVTLVDTGGNITTRTYELDSADADAAATDAGAVIAALNAVTTAVIRGYNLGEVFIEDAFTFPVSAEVENCAEITMQILGEPNDSATLTIPAPEPTIFTAGSGPGFNVVDVADTALQTYLALFGNTGPAYISDGEKAVPTSAYGRRIHKKSRRG